MLLYRYISYAERDFIIATKMIMSDSSHKTFFTADWYADRHDAKKFLALNYLPDLRVGPISHVFIPDFHDGNLKRVIPDNGEPGGGTEIGVKKPVFLTTMYDLNNQEFYNIDGGD